MWKIPLFKIYWDEHDVKSVTEAIKKGMFWAVGPNIEEFEKKIAEYTGTRYAIVFNSGTSALHAALLAHGIKEGDEVIAPSFTFIATANAPLFVGAKPVFADVDVGTCNIDAGLTKEKLSSKTSAVIPVHLYGFPADMKRILDVTREHGPSVLKLEVVLLTVKL